MMKRRYNPFARMGVQLQEILSDVTAAPGEEFKAIRRPANARFEAFYNDDAKTEAEIDLYDVIGTWETNAASFRRLLNDISAKRIVLNINSPGGAVFDGFAMFNDLRSHPAHVHVRVRGLAASAASIIAMAGDTIEIADNGFLMIHNAWSVAVGDRREMASVGKVLGQIDKRMVKTYAARTGIDEGEIVDMLDAETWLDSEEAVEMGFADTIGDQVPATALAHDVSVFGKAPASIRQAKAPERKAEPRPAIPAGEDWTQALAAIERLAAAMAPA